MVGKIGSALAVAVPLCAFVWYLATHDADAQEEKADQDAMEARQVKIEEAVDTLTAIHVRQETVAEAEAALLLKLCAEGKLPPEDCPGG